MSDSVPYLYGDYERREMAALLPVGARRVLDVGCGSGAFGAHLKSLHPGIRVVGVEPNESAAARAAERLDRVETGLFPAVQPAESFDVVYFNDVLEHMSDPSPALTAARGLAPIVVASMPNVRHVDVVRDLVLRGEWVYRDEGVLDRTHVRFYTRSTIVGLFEGSGLIIKSVVPINMFSRNRHIRRILSALRDTRFLPLQFAVVAEVSIAGVAGSPDVDGDAVLTDPRQMH
jgi:2-polyprenyl-3-methyl-5-hydroxy-6-metoxy-1,4-benzoquinol methylase